MFWKENWVIQITETRHNESDCRVIQKIIVNGVDTVGNVDGMVTGETFVIRKIPVTKMMPHLRIE